MNELNDFERELAAGLEEYAGPRQPVDARTVVRAATARAAQHRGRLPFLGRRRFAALAAGAAAAIVVAVAAGGFAAMMSLRGPDPVATAPAVEASPTPQVVGLGELGSGPPTVSAESNGILVELWVDRQQVEIGDLVHALVRVTNNSARAISRNTSCAAPVAHVAVVRPAGEQALGREWTGQAAELKRLLLAETRVGGDEDLLGTYVDRDVADRTEPITCFLISTSERMLPGASAEQLLAWRAVTRQSHPFVPARTLQPGPATVRVTFTPDGQRDLPRDRIFSVSADTTIEITGDQQPEPDPRLTLVDFIDIALSDPSFLAWVEGVPVEAWTNPNVSQWPTTKGAYPQMAPYDRLDERPIFEVGLFRRFNGVPDIYGAVIIDQETGEVLAHRMPSSAIIPDPTPPPPDPPGTPAPAGRLVRIDRVGIGEGGRTVSLLYTGTQQGPFDPANPCSSDYAGSAEIIGAELIVEVREIFHPAQATLPPNVFCTLIGYGRHIDVTLPEPFNGYFVYDRAGYVHFVDRPPEMVEIDLPDGWLLRAEETLPESPTGRWRQVFSPLPSPPSDGAGRLDLIQAFNGRTNVTGEDEQPALVNGKPATLYTYAAVGELALVWQLERHGLALVANDADLSVQELIAIAESARIPEWTPPDDTTSWGPMAVVEDSLGYGNEALGGEGVLSITDECVVLRTPGMDVVPVWRAGEAAWDADTRTIVFSPIFGERLVLRDGMQITIGGRGTWPEGDPSLPDEKWIQRPHSSCAAETFNVHSVTVH